MQVQRLFRKTRSFFIFRMEKELEVARHVGYERLVSKYSVNVSTNVLKFLVTVILHKQREVVNRICEVIAFSCPYGLKSEAKNYWGA